MTIKDKIKAARHIFSSSAPNRSMVVPSAVYNVLLLGESQAGKSTFIQAVHHYADSNYQTMMEAIGSGYTSCTKDVIQYPILTDLPTFEVFDKMRPVTAGSYLTVEYNKMTLLEFENALDIRLPPLGNYEIRRTETDDRMPQIRFNLIDTPGLNDTEGKNEVNMAKIFDALTQAGDIHLVLLVVGHGTFDKGFKDAVQCYMEAFPQLQDILAIVHTWTDYVRFHAHAPTKFEKIRTEKSQILHDIIGRSGFPHFWIDCDLASIKALRKCMTSNLIQKILSVAMYNQPISFRSAMMTKTPKMREIDELLEDKYGDLSKSLGDIDALSEVKDKLKTEMIQLNCFINKVKSARKNSKAFIKKNDTDGVELLDEIRIEDNWGFFRMISTESVELKMQPFKIDALSLIHPGFTLDKEVGGEGDFSWSARYTRRRYKNGVLHARAYVQKRNKYQQEIQDEKGKLKELMKAYRDLVGKRREKTGQSDELQEEVDRILLRNSLYTKMMEIVREYQMRPDLYRALAEAGVYRGTPKDSMQKAIEVFTEFLERPDIDEPFRGTVQEVADVLKPLYVESLYPIAQETLRNSDDHVLAVIPNVFHTVDGGSSHSLDDDLVEKVYEPNSVIVDNINSQRSDTVVLASLTDLVNGVNTTQVHKIDAVDDENVIYF